MKIAILTLGTRGDVQPYAVLGQGLRKRGHEVILSTTRNFETLVKSFGVNFLPVEADYQTIMGSDEGKKILQANPFAIQKYWVKWIYPLILQSLIEFYNLSQDCDKVIYHVKTMADSFADQFPEKMIRAMVVPIIQPTTSFINPGFSGLPIPSFLNKLSYKLTDLGIKMMSKPIKQFRKTVGLSEKYSKINTPCLYAISSAFLNKPIDYPANCYFTGFWFGNSSLKLETNLVEFINKAEPPLLLTFGSMPLNHKINLERALNNVTKEFKTRIIVVKNWGLNCTKRLEDNPSIKVINEAPFEKLFPLIKAVIHHGGAGTTTACIRAGKPFFTCPAIFPISDQQFWGWLAYKKGLAVQPVPLKNLTEQNLLERVFELLTNEKLYMNSKLLAEIVNGENGVTNAVDEIEKN